MKTFYYILFISLFFISCIKEKIYYVDSVENSQNLKIINAVESLYNIFPNDDIDDSVAINNMISANPNSIFYFQEGTYILENPIIYKPVLTNIQGEANFDNRPGLKIIGDGVNSTIFINKSADYAFKLLGVVDADTNLIPEKFQTHGYFKDFTIRTFNNQQKGGFKFLSAWHYELNNVTIIGDINKEMIENGIYVPLINNLNESNNLSISNINLFSNPDSYATINLKLNNVIISRCKGYGYYGENGVGNQITSNGSLFNSCKKAGLYISGHNCLILGGSIWECGQRNSNGEFDSSVGHYDDSCGIIVDRVAGNTPNNLIVESIEFQDNFHTQIWIRSLANGRIQNNRFVATKKPYEEDYMTENSNSNDQPLCGIRLGHYYQEDNLIRNNIISNNFFRFNDRDTIHYEYPILYLYGYTSYNIIDNNGTQPLDMRPIEFKYTNHYTKYYNNPVDDNVYNYAIRCHWNFVYEGNNYLRHNGIVFVN
jgi:hypothetical protein